MQTTLYFVRHGHVHNPREVVYARLPRFRLSEEGRRQAAEAAQALQDTRPAAIYSSPMLRARQTAEVIARAHPGLRVQISSLINENFTPYQGKTLADLRAMQWDIFSGVQTPYERPADLLARMLRFAQMVRRRHPGQAVIAVSHGDPIRFFVRWALGFDVDGGGDTSKIKYPGTGSVSSFTFTEGAERPAYELILPGG